MNFGFPETLSIFRGEAEENIEVEGPVIKCFAIPSHLKLEKNCGEIVCLTLAGL